MILGYKIHPNVAVKTTSTAPTVAQIPLFPNGDTILMNLV